MVSDALIDSDQDIEAPCHGIEEISVVQVRPTHFRSRKYFMLGKALAQSSRHTGVEQDSHLSGARYAATASESSTDFANSRTAMA